MTPEQQGAFCKVCSKVVVDFSTMSDKQVIAYLQKNNEEKTCGRFKASQLSPYQLKINLQGIRGSNKGTKIFAISLFIFFSSLFVCKSDTGDNIVFNKVIADIEDTISVTLLSDTGRTTDTTAIAEEDKHVAIGFSTVGQVSLVLKEDTIPKTTVTDTVIAKPALVMGIMIMPEPQQMINGRVICTRPAETGKGEKASRKKHNNDREIMGDITY